MTTDLRLSRALAAADSASPLLLSQDTLIDIAAAVLNADDSDAFPAAREAAPRFVDNEMLGEIVAAIDTADRGPLDDLAVEWREDVA